MRKTALSEEAREELRKALPSFSMWGWETCDRYARTLMNACAGVNHPAISSEHEVFFSFDRNLLITDPFHDVCVNARLTRGHAAVCVTFIDGRDTYYDNGAFGGIFDLGMIPWYAHLLNGKELVEIARERTLVEWVDGLMPDPPEGYKYYHP